MNRRTTTRLALALLLGIAPLPSMAEPIPVAEVARETPIDFEREIAPLLRRSCLACHNQSKAESELVLETAESIVRGGASGPAVEPGKPEESLLLELAAHRSEPAMPPADNAVGALPLGSDELGLLQLWIAQGARGSARETADVIWRPLPESINPIYAIAVSPGGNVAICNRGSRLHAYDLTTGRWLGKLVDPLPELAALGAAHHDLCQSLALAPDGRTLASGGFREVKLWRAETPAPLTLVELGAAPLRAAMSDDRCRLAVATAQELMLVDLASNSLTARTPLAAAPSAIAWSADGGRLALLAGEANIEIRASGDLTKVEGFAAPAPLGAVAFAPDGAALLTGDARGRVDRWDLGIDAPREIARDVSAFTHVALAPDGRRAVLASSQGGLYPIDLATLRPLRRWLGHSAPVTALAWLGDGRLASVSEDRTLRVWGEDRHAAQIAVSLGDAIPRGLAVTGPWMWIALDSGTLLAYRLDGLAEEAAAEITVSLVDAELQPSGETRLVALTATPDGGTLLAASCDGVVSAYDAAHGQPKYAVALGQSLHGAALAPDGKQLAVCLGADAKAATLRWLDALSGAPLEPQPASLAGAQRVAFAGPKRALVSMADGRITVVDAASAETLEWVPGASSPVRAFAARDRVLLVARDNGQVERVALRWRSGQTAHAAPVTALGRVGADRVVSGAADGGLTAWVGESAPSPLPSLGGAVRGVVAAPDGRSAAVLTDAATATYVIDQPELTVWDVDVDARLRVARERALRQGADRRLALAEDARIVAENDVTTAQSAEAAATEARAQAEKAAGEAETRLAESVAARDRAAAAAAEAIAAAARAAEARQQTRAAASSAGAQQVEAQLAAAEGLVDDLSETAARLRAARDFTQQSAVKRVPLVAELAAQLERSIASALQAEATARAALAAQRVAAAPTLDSHAKARQTMATAEADAQNLADAAKAAEEAKTAAEKAAAEAESARDQAAASVVAAQQALERAERDREVAQRQLAEHTRASDELRQRAADAVSALEALEASIARETQPLAAAAFSADGAHAAMLDAGGTLRLRATATGAGAPSIALQAAPVWVALAGDDQVRYLTGDGRLQQLERALRWRRVARLGPPSDDAPLASSTLVDRVTALAYSPDASRLASGGGEPSRSGELTLWDTATGAVQWRLPEAHSDTILSLEFSPDGRLLATASADKFVKVFQVADGALVRSFEGHTQHVLGVAWRADGLVLASAGADQAVKLWDYDKGEQLRTIGGFAKPVAGVRFLGAESHTLSGSGDGVLRLHNADDGKTIRNFAGAKTYLQALAATPDGRWLLAGGADSVLRVWSTEESKPAAEFAPPAADSE